MNDSGSSSGKRLPVQTPQIAEPELVESATVSFPSYLRVFCIFFQYFPAGLRGASLRGHAHSAQRFSLVSASVAIV